MIEFPKPVRSIVNAISEAGIGLDVVGGAVRDSLLRRSIKDFDLVTDRPIEEIQPFFPKGSEVNKRYQIISLKRGEIGLEIARMRRDHSYSGRHSEIAFVGNIEDDLPRRDFTVNSISYSLKGKRLIDPFDGVGDIERRLLRAVGLPEKRFTEDYFRILRLARFRLKLGFDIQDNTLKAARELAPGLRSLSPGLIKPEIESIIAQYPPGDVLDTMKMLGIVQALLDLSKIDIPYVELNSQPVLQFAVLIGLFGDNADVFGRLRELQFSKTMIKKAEYLENSLKFLLGQGPMTQDFEVNRLEILYWANKVGIDMDKVCKRFPGLMSAPLLPSSAIRDILQSKNRSLTLMKSMRDHLTEARLKGLMKNREDAVKILEKKLSQI